MQKNRFIIKKPPLLVLEIMATAREVLNELKWREDRDFAEVMVTYIHRGAPNDEMTISGAEIESLNNSFMQTESASIPYHRIVKIEYKGTLIWERRE
jgi:uncharacterized protein (UPF0248 family)